MKGVAPRTYSRSGGVCFELLVQQKVFYPMRIYINTKNKCFYLLIFLAQHIIIYMVLLGKIERWFMSVFQGVLQDEYNRLLQLRKIYENQLKEFPKGSLVNKKRGNNVYCYLSYREKSKVKSKYIAKVGSQKADDLIVKMNEKREIKKKLDKVKQNIRELQRVLDDKKLSLV